MPTVADQPIEGGVKGGRGADGSQGRDRGVGRNRPAAGSDGARSAWRA